MQEIFAEHMHRTDDHSTSVEAAESVPVGDVAAQVYLTLMHHSDGLTDGEIVAKCSEAHGKRPESTYRKRRTELAQAGFVVDTGKRRSDFGKAGGRLKIVWRIDFQLMREISREYPDVTARDRSQVIANDVSARSSRARKTAAWLAREEAGNHDNAAERFVEAARRMLPLEVVHQIQEMADAKR